MGIFELETIEPPSRGRAGGLLSASQAKAIEDAAFASGYKAGVDAANDGIAAEQNRFLAAISEALADQHFEFEQANAHAQKSMVALVAAIRDALAPGVAQAHFEELVVARVAAASKQSVDGELALYLAEDALAVVSPLLETSSPRTKLHADPNLSGRQARLEWAGGEDQLDLDAALSAMQELMSEYVNKISELSDERHRNAG